MIAIKLENKKLEKKLAMILSVMWPGMGLILLSKRKLGIVFAVIHVLSIFWVARNVLYSFSDNRFVQEIVLMLSIALLLGNWLIGFSLTTAEANPKK